MFCSVPALVTTVKVVVPVRPEVPDGDGVGVGEVLYEIIPGVQIRHFKTIVISLWSVPVKSDLLVSDVLGPDV